MKRFSLIAVLLFAVAGCDDGSTQANIPTPAATDHAAHEPAATACEFCVTNDTAGATADAAPSAMSTSLALTAPTTQPAEQTYIARSSEFLSHDKRESPFYLDFAVTDQDGRSFKLTELLGKPIVMSFIFTRCGNPKMCPAITVQMANLQRTLESEGLADDTRVVLLSYDPVYDTPDRLKKYAADRGFRFTTGDMILQPDAGDYRELIGELAIAVAPKPDGSFNHAMELLVIDAQGRFVRDYQGDLWQNEPIVEDVKKLVAEMKEEK